MEQSNHNNISNKNVQDVFMRNATITLLNILNKKIVIDLVRDGKVEQHKVPFMYAEAGDGQFMQDFFIDLPDGCEYPQFAEGNYDIVPRGIVSLRDFAIKSGDMTNPFVRGSWRQEEVGDNDQKTMKAYSSRLRVLPMDLKFDIDIKTDNLNKTFKIVEKMFDFYYKNEVAYFQYRGIRIPAQISFPETMTNDKKYNFEYDADKYVHTKFQVNVETYYPSFDESSTMYKGNTIQHMNVAKKLEGDGTTISDAWIDKDFPPTE